MKKLKFNKVVKVSKNEEKRSLIESIQKNNICIDYLENMCTEFEDLFRYTNKKEDRLSIEIVRWILFNMKYNTSLFEKRYKELGGNPNAIESVEWE